MAAKRTNITIYIIFDIGIIRPDDSVNSDGEVLQEERDIKNEHSEVP